MGDNVIVERAESEMPENLHTGGGSVRLKKKVCIFEFVWAVNG